MADNHGAKISCDHFTKRSRQKWLKIRVVKISGDHVLTLHNAHASVIRYLRISCFTLRIL